MPLPSLWHRLLHVLILIIHILIILILIITTIYLINATITRGVLPR